MTQLALGLTRKKQGMDRLERSIDADFIQIMRDKARAISEQVGRVSIDELRTWASEQGIVPRHPNSWGCIFRGANWMHMGLTPTTIITGHGRRIIIWRWIE